MSKNAPRDARELVGQSNGEHVMMQPLLGGLDPRLESVALPSVRFHFHKNDPCCLHEQDAQVAIAALRYLAEDRLIFNDNHDGTGGYVGNHGAAVLGEVAGVDNTRGIIGVAPNVASVRTVSWWKASDPGENRAYPR
jgi:hypothetical protein